jgi:2-polyprenyl-6-methoxyphenol hydroxylase-like FAD-dependent oxidoreductase
VKKLGFLDELIEESITGLSHEGGFAMWDNIWNQFLRIQKDPPAGLPVGGMRIIRSKLRSIFVKGTARSGDEVYWGIACVNIQRVLDDKIEVTLSNGQTELCDILIAADCASSKIRAQLRPQDALHFAGIRMITALSSFDDSSVPSTISKDWGIVV